VLICRSSYWQFATLANRTESQKTMTAEPWPPQPRGYFAIGAERMSKALNLGNLMRSAHGFGASFTFTVGATYKALEAHADTSKGQLHLPHYNWGKLDEMALPNGCKLVGIELIDGAIDLPSFRHPMRAAYVLGPEAGSLSQPLLDRCDYVVKIPTLFCVNVAMAGAIVMYDRVKSLARFPERPITEGGPPGAPVRPRRS
jgi:tRNA G18 (ribose-2'-O)-methylase SpoU